MKTSIIILCLLFSNIFNDYAHFFEELIHTELYNFIFEAFCISENVGLFACTILTGEEFYCRDLIYIYMDINYCVRDWSHLELKEKCILIKQLLSNDKYLNSKYSQRQIQIFISKIQKLLKCPLLSYESQS